MMEFKKKSHREALSLSKETAEHLRRFYFDEEPVETFETWLYQNKDLEDKIGKEFFLYIVSFDYSEKEKAKRHDLKEIIKDVYNSQKFDAIFMDQARIIAMAVLDQSCPVDIGCRKLANISENGHAFISEVFTSYSDEFDRLGSTDFYNDRIIVDIKKSL